MYNMKKEPFKTFNSTYGGSINVQKVHTARVRAPVSAYVCAKLQTTTCPLTKKADRRTQNMTWVFYEAHFHKIVFCSNQIVSHQIRNTTIVPTL